jgi:protoporphyrinogen oxidase
MDGVMILGAGLAGLGCARELPGSRVFEAGKHPGGHAYSHELRGVHFDQGAHISHAKDAEFVRMICAAAREVVEIPSSVVKNLWEGDWYSYPIQNHLHELPKELRIQALTDLVLAQTKNAGQATDYLSWCRSQYGEFLTERFYRRYTDKYWRVDMTDLATDWLQGRLIPSQLSRIIAGAFGASPERQEAFARFRYPARGGFFGFFESLYDGLNLHYGERAVEVDVERKSVRFSSGRREYYEVLASSIPLPVLVSLIHDAPTEVQEAAERLRATQLTCVNLIVNQPALTDCHWFYIYDENIDASRVSVPGNLAPGSVPAGQTALQAEVFRVEGETTNQDHLVERTVAQMGKLLKFDAARDVVAVNHVFVPRSYVISDHARAAAVKTITEWLEEHDILTMGLYGRWQYIWSDEAFRQGTQTANRIRSRTWTRKTDPISL